MNQLNEPLANYVRVHRRGAGLSQRDLGRLLGYGNECAVARHEQFRPQPPFLVALGYEVIFRVSVSEIFPGFTQTVEFSIEKRIAEFESELRGRSDSGRNATAIARKLEWLGERRNLTV